MVMGLSFFTNRCSDVRVCFGVATSDLRYPRSNTVSRGIEYCRVPVFIGTTHGNVLTLPGARA